MSKFLSSGIASKFSYNLATLLLRLGLGAVMIASHGWQKLSKFSEMQDSFVNFMGMGSSASLTLSLIAEFFCGLLVVIGLFTRGALLLLIINMMVALTLAHNWRVFEDGQLPFVFLVGWAVVFLLGPGKISLDALIFKKK